MIDPKLLREDPTKVQQHAGRKGVVIDVAKILSLDSDVRKLETEIGTLNHEHNQKSREVGRHKMLPEDVERNALKKLSQQIKAKEKKLSELKTKLQTLNRKIPNLLRDDVVIGNDDKDNVVSRTKGELPQFAFPAKDYLTLAKNLHLIDLEGAARASGTRFAALKGKAVLLELALVRWVFETLSAKGFTPLLPPVMIHRQAMEAMGYLEQGGEDEVYHLPKDDLDLVGTAEQSIGPMHQGEILPYEQLPLRYVGFSSCFRREAGSYGKDSKGILRVHQFDKCEMFSFTTPEQSDEEHRFFLSLQEQFMGELNLPYQVINICSGDTGFPAARKWDIETWIPSEQRYRETHSTSTCTDFQARRLNIRTKNPMTRSTEFVHTVNGTAFAIGRILIAIFEHYQQADGTIRIPEVLKPYTGFLEIR